MDSRNVLIALAALERRFDGPIPAELRATAMGGRPHAAAGAGSALFDRLARHATAALARTRETAGANNAEGSAERQARLARDLRLYREAGLACRDAAAERLRA